jgi:hypothetical protein
MDILALGLPGEVHGEAPQGQSTKRLRRTKLVAAFAVTALVGMGSYTATYRALEVISTPSSTVPSPSTATTTIPAPS